MRSMPWDSIIQGVDEETGYAILDRASSASDLREVYKTFFSNGVFLNDENAFHVVPGEGMNVIVSPGKCCIEGTVGWEESERVLALPSSSSQDFIATIVLRWNANVEMRNIDLYVKAGTAAEVPVRPSLTRSETVWELGLCDVFIAKNSGAVSAARITDTRLQVERCGVVTPFATIDTTTFYDQIQSAIDEKINEIDELADFTYLKGGFYAVHVDEDDGHLYAYYDDADNPPPLSLQDGRLLYTVNDDNVLDLGAVSLTPAGCIMPYAGTEIPGGWLSCNGALVSREQYPRLFSAIGTTYGAGDGSTTFALPNLQGRFPLGVSGSHALGSIGGAETVTLSTSQIPSHIHQGLYIDGSRFNILNNQNTTQGFIITSWSTGAAYRSGPDTGSTGGGQAHNNMPPFITLNYIISTGE